MIHLHIPKNYTLHADWEANLKEWCAAHKITINEALTTPEIQESGQTYKGVEAIEAFLKEYKKEMDEWNDCRCDKWMDPPK